MSDNIPPFDIQMKIVNFDIQMEIVKKFSDLKSLLGLRSVSRSWKSFIDKSEFVKGYGVRNMQPDSHILYYKFDGLSGHKFIHCVDDDNQSFMVQQQATFVMSPLLEQYSSVTFVIGMCHGLMALHCYHRDYTAKRIVAIWNPFMGKAFGIHLPLPYIQASYGFGVCPVTRDPTVVKIVDVDNKPLDVEVFTMSSGVWSVIQGGHLLRQSIKLYGSAQAVDRFIYWVAYETTIIDHVVTTISHMVLSFDLITKEFKVVDLPNSLTNNLCGFLSASKLGESLVVYGSFYVDGSKGCGVWVMDHDSSFRKLFTIGAPVCKMCVKYWGLVRVVKLCLQLKREMDGAPHLMFTTPAHNKSRILGFLN